MVVKTNDARAQQALDHEQPAGKLALRLLTATETRHIAAAGQAGHDITAKLTLGKSTAE